MSCAASPLVVPISTALSYHLGVFAVTPSWFSFSSHVFPSLSHRYVVSCGIFNEASDIHLQHHRTADETVFSASVVGSLSVSVSTRNPALWVWYGITGRNDQASTARLLSMNTTYYHGSEEHTIAHSGMPRYASEPDGNSSGNPMTDSTISSTSGWSGTSSNTNPASARSSISAMLNAEDFPDYATRQGSLSDESTHWSKMALQHALAPVPQSRRRNSFASVVLSDHQPSASYDAVHDCHMHEPKPDSNKCTNHKGGCRPMPTIDHRRLDAVTQPYEPANGGIKNSKATRTIGTRTELSIDRTPTKEASKPKRSQSERRKHTPPPSTVSSLVFSDPFAPNRRMSRRSSALTGSAGSSDNEDDVGNESGVLDDGATARSGSRDTSAMPMSRSRSDSKRPPAVQRERNRVAATKCRAKSKATISKLEQDERLVSDRRDSLSAERSKLMNEVLRLRMELLSHGHCYSDQNIQNYLRNAARMIGESGGGNPFWGPDGSGNSWAAPIQKRDHNMPQ